MPARLSDLAREKPFMSRVTSRAAGMAQYRGSQCLYNVEINEYEWVSNLGKHTHATHEDIKYRRRYLITVA